MKNVPTVEATVQARGSGRKTCTVCGGSGHVKNLQQTPFGTIQNVRTCDVCHGEGSIVKPLVPPVTGRDLNENPSR